MIKKKILFLVLNKKVIDNFLSDHIKKLSQQYDIEFISSINSNKFYIDDICYKNIIVELKRSVNFINFIKNFFTILNYLKTSKPSLTISIHPKNGLLISFSKLFYKFKNLHIVTGQIWADQKYLKKLFFKSIDKFIFFKSNYLLADSKSQISYLHKEGFNVEKIKCLHNGSICGVKIHEFQYSLSEKINFCKKKNIDVNSTLILFTGRVNKSKGILLLLNAFKSLIDKNYICSLIIIGDDEINFEKIINKLDSKYKNKIFIFNYQKNINLYYSISSIFCLPSYREGFGMSVIEASSFSLPVVVSDIYGLKDSCIDNFSGLKFKSGDTDDLIIKLQSLLDNPKKSKEIGLNGKNFVNKNFNSRDVINYLNNFINNII